MISFDLTIKKRKYQIMNCKIFAQLDCDRVISGYLTCRTTVTQPLTSCKARHGSQLSFLSATLLCFSGPY